MVGIFQVALSWFTARQKVTSKDEEGKIREVIESGKVWWVWHDGTSWFARSKQKVNFQPGDWVRVVERQGNTLFIEASTDSE